MSEPLVPLLASFRFIENATDGSQEAALGAWIDLLGTEPHIEFSDEMLFHIAKGQVTFIDLVERHPGDHPHCRAQRGEPCYSDALLTVRNGEQRVVYRIRDYVSERNTWTSSWPD